MNQQQFFHQFFGPQGSPFGPQGPQFEQPESKTPEYIVYNENIIEISNNWNDVQDLMKRYKSGKVQNMDSLEQIWYNFIVGNNINIDTFENEDKFLETYWKSS